MELRYFIDTIFQQIFEHLFFSLLFIISSLWRLVSVFSLLGPLIISYIHRPGGRWSSEERTDKNVYKTRHIWIHILIIMPNNLTVLYSYTRDILYPEYWKALLFHYSFQLLYSCTFAVTRIKRTRQLIWFYDENFIESISFSKMLIWIHQFSIEIRSTNFMLNCINTHTHKMSASWMNHIL